MRVKRYLKIGLPLLLAGAALFVVLLSWPLWLPLLETDAGRFEKIFGTPPPAGVRFRGSASAYGYDYEEIAVLFRLSPAELAAFLPDRFGFVAAENLPAHLYQDDSGANYDLLVASGLRHCRQPLAYRAHPWPGTGFITMSDAILLHCPATGTTYAKGLGLN